MRLIATAPAIGVRITRPSAPTPCGLTSTPQPILGLRPIQQVGPSGSQASPAVAGASRGPSLRPEIALELGMPWLLQERSASPSQPSQPAPQPGAGLEGRVGWRGWVLVCNCALTNAVVYGHERRFHSSGSSPLHKQYRSHR